LKTWEHWGQRMLLRRQKFSWRTMDCLGTHWWQFLQRTSPGLGGVEPSEASCWVEDAASLVGTICRLYLNRLLDMAAGWTS